jgi:hypothetical protein
MKNCRICGAELKSPLDQYDVQFDRDYVWTFCEEHFTLALRAFQSWIGNQDIQQAMKLMRESP